MISVIERMYRENVDVPWVLSDEIVRQIAVVNRQCSCGDIPHIGMHGLLNSAVCLNCGLYYFLGADKPLITLVKVYGIKPNKIYQLIQQVNSALLRIIIQ